MKNDKYLLFLKFNSFTQTFLCCFSVESGVFLIGWIGLIFSLIDLSADNLHNFLSIILHLLKIATFGLLIYGQRNENIGQLSLAYKLLCIKFYCVLAFIVIELMVIKNMIYNESHYSKSAWSQVGEHVKRGSQNLIYYGMVGSAWAYIIVEMYIIYIVYSYIQSIVSIEEQRPGSEDNSQEEAPLRGSNDSQGNVRYYENENDYYSGNKAINNSTYNTISKV
mmetsp:Transcript_36021/g.37389  ORF Transcript_36021/g.37389 Transcript_36021/m.37389 type:complete len:222 (-) Transcript_36021:51-716(-)